MGLLESHGAGRMFEAEASSVISNAIENLTQEPGEGKGKEVARRRKKNQKK